jgi:hypothetical protein
LSPAQTARVTRRLRLKRWAAADIARPRDPNVVQSAASAVVTAVWLAKSATGVLVETLLDHAADGDVAEAADSPGAGSRGLPRLSRLSGSLSRHGGIAWPRRTTSPPLPRRWSRMSSRQFDHPRRRASPCRESPVRDRLLESLNYTVPVNISRLFTAKFCRIARGDSVDALLVVYVVVPPRHNQLSPISQTA